MLFNEKFYTEAPPERVYALCKTLEIKPATREELIERLEPKGLNAQQNITGHVLNTALNTGFIKLNDHSTYSLNTPPENIRDIRAFRKAVAPIAFDDPENLFFRFTSWYISQNQTVFDSKNASELAKKLKGDFINIHEESVLGWRFWASFLGLGVLHGTLLIPNAAVRIADQLELQTQLKTESAIECSVFINWLVDACPETKEGTQNQQLSIALSNGLRLLHDRNIIELIHTPDASNTWSLFPSEFHKIESTVSHVVVKEASYEL